MQIGTQTQPTQQAVEFTRPLLLSPAQDWLGWLLGRLGAGVLTAITATSVLAVGLIFLFILREAWPFFQSGHVWEAFGSKQWHPESATAPAFGMLTIFYGSAVVTVGSLLVAAPLGLMAAMLLSDIVSFRVRQAVKPIIELLAAIPSVAYGFFAALVLAPFLQQHLGLPSGANALNCILMLSVMAIPTIVSVAEDSLSSAGRELREASYACGATRAETLIKVVVPAAHNGIIAAVILGMMRAIGETMLVWMASGNATQVPTPWYDLTQSVRTMTATIAGEMGETPKDSQHYFALFAVGLMLLVFSLGLNLVTEYLLSRVRKSSGGHA